MKFRNPTNDDFSAAFLFAFLIAALCSGICLITTPFLISFFQSILVTIGVFVVVGILAFFILLACITGGQ